MRLVLVRHCDAVHPVENPDRPLSEHGRDQARRLAAWMRASGVRANEVLHSGVLRAAETAAEIAAALQPPRGIRAEAGLRPNDPPRLAVDGLRFGEGCVVVVTHLPIVAHMAALLLTGTERGEPVAFHTGSAAAFEGEGDHWSLEWAVHPALLPPAS